MNKLKLLWIGDDYRVKTGYGRVAKELFLHLKDNYDIINYSINCQGISKEYHVIDSNDGTQFGFNKLPAVIDAVKPSVIILLNDSNIIFHWLQRIKAKSNFYKFCKIIPYVCTEYIGIPDEEIVLYNTMTHGLFAMANFTIDEFIKRGYKHGTFRLSHGYSKGIAHLDKKLAKKKLGIPEDTFVFFSGSKNQPRKRLDIIIRAFVEFLKTHNKNVLLMLNCGLVDSGWNIKNLYTRLCKENNIENIERYLYLCSSNVNDPNKNDEELTVIYNACDVGITTSTGESFGLIPFEQSSLGVPQIIPNWGGIIESIKYGCIKVDTNDFYVYPVILQSANGEARTVYYKDVTSAMEIYYKNTILYNEHTIEVKKNVENYEWKTIADQFNSFISTIDIPNIKSICKNCIFCCVFNQERYINMFLLMLESIFIYGELDNDIEILVYTSTLFMKRIKQSHLFNEEKIKFEINDTYDTADKACKSRLDLFNLNSVLNYTKILYLDIDIIVKGDINTLFDVCKEDILYTVREGELDHTRVTLGVKHDVPFWGRHLFSDSEIESIEDKTAFTSGILLFNNCEKIKFLFNRVVEDILTREPTLAPNLLFNDQPFIVYNAFKYKLYNNKILSSIVVNDDENINSDKLIHHFPDNTGIYEGKIKRMNNFLTKLKDVTIDNIVGKTIEYINNNLMPIIKHCGEVLEGNIFTHHHSCNYTDLFVNKVKNISSLLLNKNITNVMEIGFNSGFSTLLMLLTNPIVSVDCYDLGEHLYTMPCYEKMKETFGSRINITIGDSVKTLPNVKNVYDLINIDGGHLTEIANSDIINSYRLSKQGTLLIMDDYNFDNLHSLWDDYIVKYNLKKLDVTLYDCIYHDIKYVDTTLDTALEIYCINLEKNIDRKNRIEIEMKKSNLKYSFYTAIDGKTIEFEEYRHILSDFAIKKISDPNKNLGKDMTYGAAGLIITTLNLWKTIYKPCIIIEDDITLDTDFDNKLSVLLDELPRDWDILYLGHSKYPRIKQISKNLWTADKVYGTFGYVINPKYINKIINCISKFNFQIDTELSVINKNSNAYVAWPPIITHEDVFESTIQIENHKST